MKKIIKKIISVILVIAWMIVIFSFSSVSSKESNGTSKKVIDYAVNETVKITNSSISNEEKVKIVNDLNFPVRKLAHASIYLVLSILLINMLNNFNVKNKYKLVIIISFIYALTDELHQYFSDGRTSSIIDSFIDTIGALIGVVIYILIIKLINKFKKQHF